MSFLRKLADEIRAQLPMDLVPDDSDDLFLIYAVLASAKGEQVSAEDVHDAWLAWMEIHGKRHDAMVPFADLPKPIRDEDMPFVQAIRAVVRRTRATSHGDQGR